MAKEQKRDIDKDAEIDKAMGVMKNFGFLTLTRAVLAKDTASMNFFKGVLRQHGLTESEIEEIKKSLENEQKQPVKTE